MSEREERIVRFLAALRDGAPPGARAMFVLAVNRETIVNAAREFAQSGARVAHEGEVLMVSGKPGEPTPV